MRKSKSYSSKGRCGVGQHQISTPAATTKLKDRNLMGVNPLKEQFEPTAAMPMRQKHRMGGAG